MRKARWAVGTPILAVLLTITAASAFGQPQGAIEIGGFGRYTKYADTLRLDPALGAGGRVGIYVFRNWLAELDMSFADADVNRAFTGDPARDSLRKVSDELWSYRLTYNHPVSEKLKVLVGAGYSYHAYGRLRTVAPRGGGPSGLLGLRFVLNNRLSARFEGTGTYVVPADVNAKPVARAAAFNLGAQAGLSLSFFSNPRKPRIQYDTVRVTEIRIQRDTQFIPRIDTVRLVAATSRAIVIGAINFTFNKSDITPEAKRILDKIAESLIAPVNASRTVDVTGNTDAIGSEQYNLMLGQDRADQAKAYLVSKGVSDTRINARTAGKADPIAPNDTDNGRATNRRVLIMLTN